jgi:poly(3-hydroxybutyrate) depolymerase
MAHYACLRPRRAATLVLRAFLAVALLASLAPAASAQAPLSLALSRVIYNSRKAFVKPQGELKDKLDALDRELNEALRLGKTGEARRLVAKGLTLLGGRPWTDTSDYATSLVVRSDRLFVEPSRPYVIRLEQIYAPAIELTRSLVARVSLQSRRSEPATPGVSAGTDGQSAAADLGTFQGVPRDLRDAPFLIELNLARVPDGPYEVRVEVLDGDRSLGARSIDIVVSAGLEQRVRNIEAQAAKAPAALRAELLYPIDFMRNVNLSRIPLGTFDLARELATAEAAVPAVRAGKDPFAGRTGDMKRHYLLEAAGEIMPYRLYVPKAYDRKRSWPVVIALHGLGATEDSFFDEYGKLVPKLAEQHGFIVAAPLGYRVDGGYGFNLAATTDAAARRSGELSEQDVMEVLARVKASYNVDENRIYLMGHSMGAIGTWRLGAKYPAVWAALAPISGYGIPATVEAMRHIPEIVIHGDADVTVPVAGSRAMVAQMQRLGVDVQYIEVPGGNHIDIAAPNLPAIFDFFDAHTRRKPGS